MQKFQFQIAYKKGSEMPVNYLTQNIIDAITWQPSLIQQEQDADPLL
jgi:hypothetical protein